MRIGSFISLIALTTVLGTTLAGCISSPFGSSSSGAASTPSAESGGNVLSNLFFYGGTTVPPAAKNSDEQELECPTVDISDGGAALRLGGAESASVRQQITLNQIARECSANGNILNVKVGAQGLVLLGPSGSAGTTGINVKFVARRGDTIVSSSVQRVNVTIPSGQTQAAFTVIAQDLKIPAPTDNVKIEVGLDSGGGSAPAKRKRR